MTKHKTLFLTQRGLQHQKWAMEGAPPELELVMRRGAGREEILSLLADVEFLITERTGVIDAEMIAAAPKLRLIQRLGRQVWDIDLDAARRAGVPVCCWPIEGCVMVAEHMMLQMLGLLKRLREAMHITAEAADYGVETKRGDEDTFAYNWSKRTGIGKLSGATVGILGFGEIGWELVEQLRGFHCTVLYHKRTRLPAPVEEQLGVEYASPEAIAERSDIVCSLLPYQGTKEPIDAAYFARMKPGSLFVHCGSGATVDEAALLDALRSGHLAGAALDTYTYEPLRPEDPLVQAVRDPMLNLILTPHIAAGGFTAGGHSRSQDYDNILALLQGRALKHRVV
ncbi:NAD(P)-dependent oxidoreductase [Caldilinea sp.]|uniref:NAD(P)-dependent oxidoreductase n=1 Tax=Caldilinea sp. TaxID=2293560 RepID=UPI002634CBE4|nr:NAD(P)-dependent oxidoreductase [uncultured Caldilinea sp.]